MNEAYLTGYWNKQIKYNWIVQILEPRPCALKIPNRVNSIQLSLFKHFDILVIYICFSKANAKLIYRFDKVIFP